MSQHIVWTESTEVMVKDFFFFNEVAVSEFYALVPQCCATTHVQLTGSHRRVFCFLPLFTTKRP